jgi:uncharacterized membrane protein YdbT with pleckstrin-like domain
MELMQDETMVWQGRPSPRAMVSYYVKWIVIGVIPVVVMVVVGSQQAWGALASAVVIAIALATGWLRRIATLYTITDRRIIIRNGILSRREHEAHIDRVQNVNLSQTLLDRVFHVGSLDFDTAGTEDSDFRFVGIADPDALRARVSQEYARRRPGS